MTKETQSKLSTERFDFKYNIVFFTILILALHPIQSRTFAETISCMIFCYCVAQSTKVLQLGQILLARVCIVCCCILQYRDERLPKLN